MLLTQSTNFSFTLVEVCVLLLYGGFILLLILFGWDLLARFLRADKRMRGDVAYRVFFIIAIAMIGYGVYLLPATARDFLPSIYEPWVAAVIYFIILLIVGPMGYVCLKILLKKRKLLAAGISITGVFITLYMAVITIIMMVNPTSFGGNISALNNVYIYPVWAMIGIFAIVDFVGIIYIMTIELAPQKQVRRKILMGIGGILIAIIGAIIENVQSSDDWIWVVGTLIELFGFLTMRYFFLSIPSYDEFAWKSGMIEMHAIIAETGISLYYRAFAQADLHGDIKVTASIPESEARPNSDLVAGGLVGIKGMLAEISGDKGKLENIEIGEKSLVFKQGKVVLVLLLADENLGVYHSLLEDLVKMIEDHHPDLDNFNGDTRQLHIKPLVNEVFGLSKDEDTSVEKSEE